MTMEQPVDSHAIEGAKRQIRGLVDEIAKLSKQELEPDVYYGEFLQRVVSALAAVGGAIWTLTPDRRLRLDFQINLRETPIAEPGDDHDGEPMDIRYNYRFVVDILRILSEEKVYLELWDERRPGVVRAVGQEDYLYVLMPMKRPEEMDQETE